MCSTRDQKGHALLRTNSSAKNCSMTMPPSTLSSGLPIDVEKGSSRDAFQKLVRSKQQKYTGSPPPTGVKSSIEPVCTAESAATQDASVRKCLPLRTTNPHACPEELCVPASHQRAFFSWRLLSWRCYLAFVSSSSQPQSGAHQSCQALCSHRTNVRDMKRNSLDPVLLASLSSTSGGGKR